jgi:hypothetical protein
MEKSSPGKQKNPLTNRFFCQEMSCPLLAMGSAGMEGEVFC